MKKNTVASVWNKIADLLTLLVLLLSVAITIVTATSRKSGIPSLLGYTLFSVQTDSMEPTFQPGDMILGKKVADGSTLQDGDVVTYWMLADGKRILNTHRIVGTEEIDGTLYYTTKGDNPNAPTDPGTITQNDVVAGYSGIRLPGAGKAFDFLRSQKGFFICVLIPMLLLFLNQIFRFVKDYKAYVLEEAAERAESKELSEDEKRRIAEAYLADHGDVKANETEEQG